MDGFKTKGQELFSQVTSAAAVVVSYGLAILAVVYLLETCGPETRRNECVCNCGQVTP